MVLPSLQKIDVLMCIGSREVDGLFIDSLQSLLKYFPFLGHLYLVTPDKQAVQEKIKYLEFSQGATVFADEEVLDPCFLSEDGWYKQQVIKLEAPALCKTRFMACLSSDTLLLEATEWKDFFSQQGLPLLYYKQYNSSCRHHDYERGRMQNIERILKRKAICSLSLVDFILDFTIWDMQVLVLLKKYLVDLYGPQPFKTISPGKCDTLAKKQGFGEWSLYAAFVLDVLQEKVEIKGFNKDYFVQIHSQKDLEAFAYDSKIVHFVAKDLNLELIRSRIKQRENSPNSL